jgi:hypothetical protein
VKSLIASASSFNEVKELFTQQNIQVKEGDDDLYLLYSDERVPQNVLQIQSNGLIFQKETNNLVCAAQNKIVELATVEAITEMMGNELSSKPLQLRMEYCEDGTVVRLFNHEGVWRTATTRCTDGRKSKWSSSKSFDEMFREVFDMENMQSSLDVAYTYIFVLVHNENRIVVKHRKNGLIYISRINNATLQEDYINVFGERVWRPKFIPSLNASVFEEHSLPYKRGVLFKLYDKEYSSWTTFKVDFNEYIHLKNVRGNVPNISQRYLELVSNPDMLKVLLKHYSEHKQTFRELQKSVNKLVKDVFRLYIESHMKHTLRVEEESPFYRTLKQLHAQYKTTNKPISVEDVQNKLYNLHGGVLNNLINQNQNQNQNQNIDN